MQKEHLLVLMAKGATHPDHDTSVDSNKRVLRDAMCSRLAGPQNDSPRPSPIHPTPSWPSPGISG